MAKKNSRAWLKNVEAIKAMLEKLPTCDHIYPGLDSFDRARGDHLCFSQAVVQKVKKWPGTRYRNEMKMYCDHHAPEGAEDLPWAEAYRGLKSIIDEE